LQVAGIAIVAQKIFFVSCFEVKGPVLDIKAIFNSILSIGNLEGIGIRTDFPLITIPGYTTGIAGNASDSPMKKAGTITFFDQLLLLSINKMKTKNQDECSKKSFQSVVQILREIKL
jgi:hypothetical protein